MRQFDVCRLKTPSDQYILILQHDIVDGLHTRVVAPLSAEPYQQLIARLRIPVEFEGISYVVQLDRMAAIRTAEIGQVQGNLADFEHAVKNGMDLLLSGV